MGELNLLFETRLWSQIASRHGVGNAIVLSKRGCEINLLIETRLRTQLPYRNAVANSICVSRRGCEVNLFIEYVAAFGKVLKLYLCFLRLHSIPVASRLMTGTKINEIEYDYGQPHWKQVLTRKTSVEKWPSESLGSPQFSHHATPQGTWIL